MAKLFANKFNLDALANPQRQVQAVNQGEATLKQQISQQQAIQIANNRDVFGRTISMADRYRQYAAAGSTAHLPEYTLSDYNTGGIKRTITTQKNTSVSLSKDRVDLFGKSISLVDRFNQFAAIGSTAHLGEYVLSSFNIRPFRDPFGKTIKLTDRFKQYAEITSTSHLPEYVLSDWNTGYLDKLLGNKNAGGRFTDQSIAIGILEYAGIIKPVNKNYADAPVNQGRAEVSTFPLKRLLEKLGTTFFTTSLTEFRKEKLTIPDIRLEKIKAGDRTFDPNIRIKRIAYDEVSIINNNLILGVTTIPDITVNKSYSKNDLITNPNIRIELTGVRTFIVDPQVKVVKPLEPYDEETIASAPSLFGLPPRLSVVPQVGIDPTLRVISPKSVFITNPRISITRERITINYQEQASVNKVVEPSVIQRPEQRHGTVNVNTLFIEPDQFLTVPLFRPIKPRDIKIDQKSAPQPIARVQNIRDPEARHGTPRFDGKPVNIDSRYLILNKNLINSLERGEFFIYTSRELREILASPYIAKSDASISILNNNGQIGFGFGAQNISNYYFPGIAPVYPPQSVEGGTASDGEIRPVFSQTFTNAYTDASRYTQTQAQNTSPLRQAAENSTEGLLQVGPNRFEPGSTPIDAGLGWVGSGGTGGTSLPGDYKALTYPEIAAKRSSSERPTKDFTVTTSSDSLETWRVRLGMPDSGEGDILYSGVGATATDLVKVKIGSLQFRAYITSFSDNYAPSYTDVNYVGRPDVLKVYKSSTRSISLGFKVAAFSNKDLKGMYKKMEALVKNTTMASVSGIYAKGPMTSLTVGGWVQNAPVIIGSLKFDTNPTEYTWDIEHEVPQIVDVSLDCVVLASNGGAEPFTTSGQYIAYG